MAHAIFGRRFVGMREPAWHRLGTVIPAGTRLSVEEALRIGGVDFTYTTVPVGYTTPGGVFVQSGARQVILRSPTHDDPQWRELGVVSAGYRYLQNVELARGLDAIAARTGWSFETVGALHSGATVFMTLRTGRRSVFGDDFETYLVVSDSKAAQRALQIRVAPVRVVCQNTLLAAESEAIASVTIAHDQAVRREYGFWLDLIEQLQTAQDQAFRDLEAMASVRIGLEQATTIIHAAFPLPAKSAKAKQAAALLALPTLSDVQRELVMSRTAPSLERTTATKAAVTERRQAAVLLYQRFNAGREQGNRGRGRLDPETLYQVYETPYAALQAVTELVDWGGTTNAQVAAASALFGSGAEVKQRAWTAALAVVATGGKGMAKTTRPGSPLESDGGP